LTTVLLVRIHTCNSFDSNGAAATVAKAYRHSRLDKNSAGFRDSELEALYKRRGPRRHVSWIRSNKLRGIGNRHRARSRAKPRTRAHSPLFPMFTCTRCMRKVHRDCPRLCYDCSVLLGGSRRSALTTYNDTTLDRNLKGGSQSRVRAILIFNCYCFFTALSSISNVWYLSFLAAMLLICQENDETCRIEFQMWRNVEM